MVEKFVAKHAGKIWLGAFTLWTIVAVHTAIEANQNEKEYKKVLERQKEVIERMERIIDEYEKGGAANETK